METARVITCLGTLVAFAGAPALTAAEDTCSGYWVRVGTTEIVLSNDTTWPGHMAIAACESSSCTYKDRDGDSWTNRSESTGRKGTWKTVSGTGKYRKKADSGWWQTSRTDVGTEGSISVGAWGGTCKLD